MPGRTFRIVFIGVFALLGFTWTVISLNTMSMYVPPPEIQKFIMFMLSGKIVEHFVEKKNGPNATES